MVQVSQVLEKILRTENWTLGSVQDICWTLNQTIGSGSVGSVQVQASKELELNP